MLPLEEVGEAAIEAGVDEVREMTGVDDVSYTKPPVTLGISDMVLVTSSRFLRSGTAAFAAPLNDTRAFSARHERFAVLKRARMDLASSGMEKLLAPSSILGTDSPSVTLLKPPSSVVVVQPVAPVTLQTEPVKPLMQIQAQFPEFKNAEPPF